MHELHDQPSTDGLVASATSEQTQHCENAGTAGGVLKFNDQLKIDDYGDDDKRIAAASVGGLSPCPCRKRFCGNVLEATLSQLSSLDAPTAAAKFFDNQCLLDRAVTSWASAHGLCYVTSVDISRYSASYALLTLVLGTITLGA